MSWKLIKEYLGYNIKSPRDSIKTAFQIELIKDGSTWLEALMDRNLTVHTYDETIANEVYEKIKENYSVLLEELFVRFKDEELKELKEYLEKNNIGNSYIFGSRAKGNYKLGSDVDIAVDGDERKLSYLLNEESNLPYYFDIININKIKNKNLLDHIKKAGVLF